MEARIIPATARRVSPITPAAAVGRLKVAAYCRVSTNNEEQESSYEVQVSHYDSFIRGNPRWEFAGIYADDGISATSMKHRDQFNRMIADAEAGRIDRILTKSISRFCRNTVDCLRVVRQLKANGVSVFFEKENIDTAKEEGEFILTIRASLAQQESESISKNVKMGYRYRFQEGKVIVNCSRFLGYTRNEKNGPLVIVPEEAVIVRRIFREYLEGNSCIGIANGLSRDGLRNGAGSTKWWDTNIEKILTNEKYIGDACLQKTITIDPLEKKRVRNTTEPQYYVEGSHPAIIPKEVFNAVQAEMKRRSTLTNDSGVKTRYSAKNALTGLVFCAECGEVYRRTYYMRGDEKVPFCICRGRKRKDGDCKARIVKEDEIRTAVMKAITKAHIDESVLGDFEANLKVALCGMSDELMEIDAQISQLQGMVMKKALAGEDTTELGQKIEGLRETRCRLAAGIDEAGTEERVGEMMNAVREKRAILPYNEALVRKCVRKVTVTKTGVSVELA